MPTNSPRCGQLPVHCPAMITQTNLIQSRGWTKTLISRFAARPDCEAENPHYKCAAPMKLYSLKRILKIEKRVRFRREFERAQARKAAAAKAAATKEARMEVWVSNLPTPHLPERTPTELTALAVRAFNERGPSPGREDNWVPADERSDPEFLERIAVNYVRHELTRYEAEMLRACGRVGAANARSKIRTRVLGDIAGAYPWLWEACDRQQEKYDREEYDR